ncbi:efflux RND transporter permease subunit [Candidatus Uabimicrobium amorphum]|uniref:Acriflavin resistance protein n=1 Tax=Uabimicrobium amorphum TaxID=2596890 RepID=A0A5S9ITI4_UABAM|nr:efflux RND transporter permease subunit [Candidatus Uabimicrobium amorphum]BBM87868.1 acriflavin resistance protein [Candidatus Uabimicrobium amorphum]
MIRYMAKHATAANIITLAIVFVGCFFLPSLRRETFPDFESDIVQVVVVYPGASAAEVENEIVNKMEESLSAVSYISKIKSEAHEGLAKVSITMDDSGNIDKFLADIRNNIESIKTFPQEIEKPVVSHFNIHIPVTSIAVTGEMSVQELKDFCEELKSELRQHNEISQIELHGFSERQICIEVSQDKLLQYKLNIAQIAQKISQNSIDLPSGSVSTGHEEILVRYADERQNLEEFAKVVVLNGQRGEEIQLGDIAQLSYVLKVRENKIMFNNKRAGLLTIFKEKEQDGLRILDLVQSFIANKNDELPETAHLAITQDVSSIVRERLDLLMTNGWQGLLLVFLSMWLFFNFPLAFWVSMGLPVSFLTTFCIMFYLGYSLNMMTMLALLIALGLVMDDAIVIAENIATHLQKGEKPLEAVVRGINEVKMGVISSFLTTAFVFVPLAFMEGNLGKILQVIPVVLLVVLIVSILEAFFILPSHLVHTLSPEDHGNRLRQRVENFIEFLRAKVLHVVVTTAIRHRYLVMGLLIGIVCIAMATLTGGIKKFRAFPDLEGNIAEARILLPQGTPLEDTEELVGMVDAAFSRVRSKIQEQYGEEIMRNKRVVYGINVDAKESGAHLATISVDLVKNQFRSVLSSEINDMWRKEVGELPQVLSINFAQRVIKPAGVPIEILLHGEDISQLKEVSILIQSYMSKYKGVVNLRDDLRSGKKEVLIRLKQGATELVDAQTIAQQLRSSFHGHYVQNVQVAQTSFEVEVKLPKINRDEIHDIANFYVTTNRGQQIPLHAVADLEVVQGFNTIRHVREKRTVTIEGDINHHQINLQEFMAKFRTEYLTKLCKQFPQVEISISGETENSAVTSSSIWLALIIGSLGVFTLLSFQFGNYREPIMIMTAIPFAFVGVVIGHFIMQIDLSLASLLGFASLAGIVVNDSILLVEFIKNKEREHGAHAAVLASKERFRAVFLTSLTTMAGLLPLLLERSVQAQVLIPIATSLVFGLLSSTVLVLVVLPCMYNILNDMFCKTSST